METKRNETETEIVIRNYTGRNMDFRTLLDKLPFYIYI